MGSERNKVNHLHLITKFMSFMGALILFMSVGSGLSNLIPHHEYSSNITAIAAPRKNINNISRNQSHTNDAKNKGGKTYAGQGGSKYGITMKSNAGTQWSRMAGVHNGIFGKTTKSNYSLNYADLVNNGYHSGATSTEATAVEYGRALNMMGLDHSGMYGIGQDLPEMIARKIGGAILIVGEGVNLADYFLFRALISLLNMFNPLEWISRSGLSGPGRNFLAPLIMLVRHWIYGDADGPGARSVGLVFAALALGFCLLRGLMGSGKSLHGLVGAFEGWLLRAFGILVLPALLLAVLMFSLHSIGGAFSANGDLTSEYAVYSTLVNDKDWIQHTRLALPNECNERIPQGLEAQYPASDHKMVLAINAEGAGLKGAQDANRAENKGDIDDNGGKGNTAGSILKSNSVNMIHQWMQDNYYKDSDWSAFVRGEMPPSVDTADSEHMVEVLESKKAPSTKTNGNMSSASVGTATKGMQYPFIHNGTLTEAPNGTFQTESATSVGHNSSNYTPLPDLDEGGISTVGMYNYLATVFKDNGMQWTSSSSLLNMLSTPVHKSVGLAGRGVAAVGGYMLMVALMLAVGVLGLMLIAFDGKLIIKDVPMMFVYLVNTELGMVGGMIKLADSVILLVVAYVGTALLFVIGRQVLIALSQIPDHIFDGYGQYAYNGGQISMPFLRHIPGGVAEAGAASPTIWGIVNMMMALIMCIAVVWLGRMKKPVYDAFNQWFKTQIYRLFHRKRPNKASAGASNSSHGLVLAPQRSTVEVNGGPRNDTNNSNGSPGGNDYNNPNSDSSGKTSPSDTPPSDTPPSDTPPSDTPPSDSGFKDDGSDTPPVPSDDSYNNNSGDEPHRFGGQLAGVNDHNSPLFDKLGHDPNSRDVTGPDGQKMRTFNDAGGDGNAVDRHGNVARLAGNRIPNDNSNLSANKPNNPNGQLAGAGGSSFESTPREAPNDAGYSTAGDNVGGDSVNNPSADQYGNAADQDLSHQSHIVNPVNSQTHNPSFARNSNHQQINRHGRQSIGRHSSQKQYGNRSNARNASMSHALRHGLQKTNQRNSQLDNGNNSQRVTNNGGKHGVGARNSRVQSNGRSGYKSVNNNGAGSVHNGGLNPVNNNSSNMSANKSPLVNGGNRTSSSHGGLNMVSGQGNNGATGNLSTPHKQVSNAIAPHNTQTPNLAIPHSTRASNQHVMSARAGVSSARQAVHNLSHTPNVPRPKLQAAHQRLTHATSQLHTARVNAARFQEHRPVTPRLMKHGARAIKRPANWQARQVYQKIGHLQTAIGHEAQLPKSAQQMSNLKTYGNQLDNQESVARSLGLNPASFKTPSAVQRSTGLLNGNISRALQGSLR